MRPELDRPAETEYLVSGLIHSFDQGETPFRHMLVREGKVAQLSREPLPYAGPRLDMAGQVVVPAFIDTHVHILELGLQLILPSFDETRQLDEVFDRLSMARGQAAAQGFVIAFNLEPDNLKERRMPTARELDRVIPDRPLLVYRIDGHSASLNTAALRMVFVGDLADGLELDAHDEPTGIVSGQAYETASRRFKRMPPRELQIEAFERAADNALRAGVLALGAFVGSDEPGDDVPELLTECRPRLPIETVVFPQTMDVARVRAWASSASAAVS